MSPDTVMLILMLGNPIGMAFAGNWFIRFGKQVERPFFVIFGKFLCVAAPISLAAGVLGLAIVNLRH